MADLSITSTAVLASGSGKTVDGNAGATIAAGDVVYLDPATGTFLLADNDSATAAARSPLGVALNGGVAGQPVEVLKSGKLTLNAVLTKGVAVYLSGTAGKMCPVADVTSGHYPVLIGFAQSTTVLDVKIHEAGVAV